ncbi:MAG: response regulator [Planctomycetota bacterium]|nr:response regulator [Planctomycetota bacterium]
MILPMPKILVVEDDVAQAMNTTERLRRLGYRLAGDFAATGADAILYADTFRPDITLMDISLQGGMDGIEAARELITRFHIPSLFVTAFGTRLEGTRWIPNLGVLSKPWSNTEFNAKMAEATWEIRNKRRGDLIEWDIAGELSESEIRELDELQREADKVLHEIAPPTLGDMEQRINKVLGNGGKEVEG